MTGAVISTLRSWAAQARAAQLAALADFSALDEACRDHMTHGAMAGADPLTDSLYSQLEAPAAEGAQQATPYGAGQQPDTEPQGNHVGWWLTGCTLLAALAGAALLPWRA